MTAQDDITAAARLISSALDKLTQAAAWLVPPGPPAPSPAEVTVPDPPAAHGALPGGF